VKKGIKKIQEEIERKLDHQKQSLGTVSNIAGTVAAAQTGNPAVGTTVSKGLGFLGKMLSSKDERYLKEKEGVSDEKLLLYKDPVAVLARHLLECIDAITTKKNERLLLLLDTCELIVHVEEWFTDHFLIPLADGNANVVLIFSGRYNPYTQRTIERDGKTMDIRGMADRMSYPPQRIDLQLFSRRDIETYLRQKEYRDIDDKVIEFVQRFSRGVPFAVDLLFNALEQMGTDSALRDFGGNDFETQLKRANSDEAVIREVSRRFLKYCLDETGSREDRDRIFSIAVLEDTRPDTLEEIWQVKNTHDILQELQARYALFIGHGKLHDVVKDFLVDYLLENENLRSDAVGPYVQRALPLFEKKYREECEEEPDWEDRFREDLWKESLQRLMNARAWDSPNDAVDFFIQRSIELFLLSPNLIRKLKQPLDKFLRLEKGIRRKNRRKINTLMEAV
ncbi:MAG: hypothetical protein GY950_15130, partial [bacterium]|nr:hypothetical protein [bacterium]